jgi:hypothetical protein
MDMIPLEQRGEQQFVIGVPIIHGFHRQSYEEEHRSIEQWRPARSSSTMPPFPFTTYPTGAHRCVIVAAGNEGEQRVLSQSSIFGAKSKNRVSEIQ